MTYLGDHGPVLRQSNPDATEEEFAELVSRAWKELPEEDRQVYLDREGEARMKYKIDMAEWRKVAAANRKASREVN